MRPLSFLLSLLLLSFTTSAQSLSGQVPQLSEQSHISLITCGPGEELYEGFGHTAVLVYDPVLGIETVYNYGTFNFNQPNFYLNFTRGNLLYTLATGRFGYFVRAYVHYERSVREQVLNLTLEQRQAVFEKLEWNALPENADYLYDYFFDNCSTRPRDVIEQALGGIIVYDSSHVEMPRKTIRELVDRCIKRNMPWGDLGIDICLGSPIDKVATAREYMYLPEELEKAFDHATLIMSEGDIPLVLEKRVLYEAPPKVEEKSWFAPQPLFVGILLALALAVTLLRMAGFSTAWIEGTIFILTGLLGWSLLLLWFGTNHTAAAYNWNLLWAFPGHLIFGMVLFRKQRPTWTRGYALFTIGLSLLLLLGWNHLPQLLHYSLKFIVVLQLFLAVGVFRMSKQGARDGRRGTSEAE
jgi:hypothetical protein